jgi:hypothetical protein
MGCWVIAPTSRSSQYESAGCGARPPLFALLIFAALSRCRAPAGRAPPPAAPAPPVADHLGPGRRAWHECRPGLAGAELADIDEMEAVDILVGRDGLDDLAGIDVIGQRKLDQDAVDGRIGVEVGDQPEQRVLRGVG